MTISSDIQLRAIGVLSTFHRETVGKTEISQSILGGFTVELSPDSQKRTEHSQNDWVDVQAFTSWLDARVVERGLGEQTALCYRKWVSSHLEDLGHPDTAPLRAWIPPSRRERFKEEAATKAESVYLNDLDDTKLFVSSTQKNQRYLSFISEKVLDLLVDDLMPAARSPEEDSNPSRNRIAAMETAMWFMCTLWTGLRPHEWPSARLLGEYYDPDTHTRARNVLEVATLKQTGRREDNPLKSKRYLMLDSWPDRQIHALKIFLGMVYEHEDADAFVDFYDRRRKLLQRSWQRVRKRHGESIEHLGVEVSPSNRERLKAVTKSTSSPSVHGNHLTFYTARHAFAEELRRSGEYSRFEIAALMGHSMITNQSYYGPRMEHLDREHTFTLPRCWPGEADAIQMWDQTANPHRGKFMSTEELSKALLDTEGKNRNSEEKDGIASFWLGM
jgi:integrase